MKTLLETVSTAPSAQPLFAAGARVITAGQIRKTAADIAADIAGEELLFLHTRSASLFLAGLLAMSRKGLTLGLPAHLQPHYLKEIGADRGVVLTDERADIATARTIVLSAEDAPASSGEGAKTLSMMFFTSGVTGTPKQVAKSIAQLDREAFVLEEVWGRRAGRVFATVSHQHIYGMLFRIFWPVISGRVSEDNAADYWEQLAGKLEGATLVSSPAHLTRLSSTLTAAAPSLIFSSGGPLPYAAAEAVHGQLGSRPIEVLGSTETGGIAWRQQVSADAAWTPLPGVETKTESDGALVVRSPFTDNECVATGDLAQTDNGQFRLLGRADRVAKIDGKRVSLERVEQAILELPTVAAVAAIDLPERKGALGAIVELSEQGIAALKELGAFRLSRTMRADLVERLEPSERPKHWRFGAIPVNRQGKRVQALLRAQFGPPKDNALGIGTILSLESDHTELELTFPSDLVWFKGHFPEEPVLPGIAQVHLAVLWAERLWDWKPEGANLMRLKFRRIVRPGRTLLLSLQRDVVVGRLKFAYRAGDVVISEGSVGGDA